MDKVPYNMFVWTMNKPDCYTLFYIINCRKSMARMPEEM